MEAMIVSSILGVVGILVVVSTIQTSNYTKASRDYLKGIHDELRYQRHKEEVLEAARLGQPPPR